MVEVAEPTPVLEDVPSVAVLIGGLVASAGEATALAFRGRPNTLFVGETTCGVATGNFTFGLSDGAKLVLSVSYMADRHQRTVPSGVGPDVFVDGPEDAIEQAVEWIRRGD